MAAASNPAASFSVTGKTALVTGAGSGINLCFARLLLSRGCNVVIADLALRPEAEQLVKAHADHDGQKPRAVFVKTDVTIWDDLTNMFNVTDKEFGGADIVCPGAGVFEPHWSNFWHPPGTAESEDPLHGTNGVGHYALFDINLTHPIRTTQIAITRWLNPAEGSDSRVSSTNPKRIVHVTSIAGQVPSLVTPMYMASKHALSGFIRSLAELDALGIRVNGVAPGVIRTPLWTEHPEKLKLLGEQDEWVEPEEVAEAMLKCCEDDDFVGGDVIEVLKQRTRKQTNVNDPGPQGPGATNANREALNQEVMKALTEPGWGLPQHSLNA